MNSAFQEGCAPFAGHKLATCTCSPGAVCPGLHPQKRGQQVEGGSSAPPLSPALEPSAQERQGCVGAGPEESTAMIGELELCCCEDGS